MLWKSCGHIISLTLLNYNYQDKYWSRKKLSPLSPTPYEMPPQHIKCLLRAVAVVKLNSLISILASPKHKNPYYSSGAKGKIFTFIAIVHSYVCLCTVAES